MSLERERLLGNLLDRLDALEAKLAELAGSAITLQVVGDRAAPGDGFLSGWRATGTTLQSPEGEIVLDSSIPAVQVMDETGSERARLGRLDGITDPTFGTLAGFGLWTDAVYLTGGINATEGTITGLLDMGDGGEIRVGTGTPGTDFTGLRLYRSGTTYRLEGQNAGSLQAYFDSDGKLRSGDGGVTLDEEGLHLMAGGSVLAGTRSVRWDAVVGNPLYPVAYILGWEEAAAPHLHHLELQAGPMPVGTSGETVISLGADRTEVCGWLSVEGDIGYDGDLRPVRGGTTYTGYAVIPEPSGGITDDAWNGNPKSAGDYTIDTSAWGLPAGVKAVWIRLTAKWTAAGGSYWAGARRDSSAQYTVVCTSQVAGVPYTDGGLVPCDSSGNFVVHIAAATSYTYLVITGYVL